jgi:hypothetical protein
MNKSASSTNFYAQKYCNWRKKTCSPQLALQGQFQNEMKKREENCSLVSGENLWACKWDTPKRWHMWTLKWKLTGLQPKSIEEAYRTGLCAHMWALKWKLTGLQPKSIEVAYRTGLCAHMWALKWKPTGLQPKGIEEAYRTGICAHRWALKWKLTGL